MGALPETVSASLHPGCTGCTHMGKSWNVHRCVAGHVPDSRALAARPRQEGRPHGVGVGSLFMVAKHPPPTPNPVPFPPAAESSSPSGAQKPGSFVVVVLVQAEMHGDASPPQFSLLGPRDPFSSLKARSPLVPAWSGLARSGLAQGGPGCRCGAERLPDPQVGQPASGAQHTHRLWRRHPLAFLKGEGASARGFSPRSLNRSCQRSSVAGPATKGSVPTFIPPSTTPLLMLLRLTCVFGVCLPALKSSHHPQQ